jgi:hypothetical protein
MKINRNVNVKQSVKRLFSDSKFVETILIFFHDKIIFTAMEEPSPTQALTYLNCVTVKSRTILPDYLQAKGDYEVLGRTCRPNRDEVRTVKNTS